MADVLPLVEARLRSALGEPDARAAVTFLGTDRIEVLRFTERRTSSATPRSACPPSPWPTPRRRSPTRSRARAPSWSCRSAPAGADTDKVLRPLAVLAASPQVEGLVVAPGASLDVGGPLWPGAPFTSVLVAEPGGLVEDLELDEPADPVRFLPLLPMTPNEAAWKRVHGAAGPPGALAERAGRTCATRRASPSRSTDPGR